MTIPLRMKRVFKGVTEPPGVAIGTSPSGRRSIRPGAFDPVWSEPQDGNPDSRVASRATASMVRLTRTTLRSAESEAGAKRPTGRVRRRRAGAWAPGQSPV